MPYGSWWCLWPFWPLPPSALCPAQAMDRLHPSILLHHSPMNVSWRVTIALKVTASWKIVSKPHITKMDSSTLKLEGEFGGFTANGNSYNVNSIFFTRPSAHTYGGAQMPMEMNIKGHGPSGAATIVIFVEATDMPEYDVFMYSATFGTEETKPMKDGETRYGYDAVKMDLAFPNPPASETFLHYKGNSLFDKCGETLYIISKTTIIINKAQLNELKEKPSNYHLNPIKVIVKNSKPKEKKKPKKDDKKKPKKNDKKKPKKAGKKNPKKNDKKKPKKAGKKNPKKDDKKKPKKNPKKDKKDPLIFNPNIYNKTYNPYAPPKGKTPPKPAKKYPAAEFPYPDAWPWTGIPNYPNDPWYPLFIFPPVPKFKKPKTPVVIPTLIPFYTFYMIPKYPDMSPNWPFGYPIWPEPTYPVFPQNADFYPKIDAKCEDTKKQVKFPPQGKTVGGPALFFTMHAMLPYPLYTYMLPMTSYPHFPVEHKADNVFNPKLYQGYPKNPSDKIHTIKNTPKPIPPTDVKLRWPQNPFYTWPKSKDYKWPKDTRWVWPKNSSAPTWVWPNCPLKDPKWRQPKNSTLLPPTIPQRRPEDPAKPNLPIKPNNPKGLKSPAKKPTKKDLPKGEIPRFKVPKNSKPEKPKPATGYSYPNPKHLIVAPNALPPFPVPKVEIPKVYKGIPNQPLGLIPPSGIPAWKAINPKVFVIDPRKPPKAPPGTKWIVYFYYPLPHSTLTSKKQGLTPQYILVPAKYPPLTTLKAPPTQIPIIIVPPPGLNINKNIKAQTAKMPKAPKAPKVKAPKAPKPQVIKINVKTQGPKPANPIKINVKQPKAPTIKPPKYIQYEMPVVNKPVDPNLAPKIKIFYHDLRGTQARLAKNHVIDKVNYKRFKAKHPKKAPKKPVKKAPKKAAPKKAAPKKNAPKKNTPKKNAPKKNTPKKNAPKKKAGKKTVKKHVPPPKPAKKKVLVPGVDYPAFPTSTPSGKILYSPTGTPLRELIGYEKVCDKWELHVLVNRHFKQGFAWKHSDFDLDKDGKSRTCVKWRKVPRYKDLDPAVLKDWKKKNAQMHKKSAKKPAAGKKGKNSKKPTKKAAKKPAKKTVDPYKLKYGNKDPLNLDKGIKAPVINVEKVRIEVPCKDKLSIVLNDRQFDTKDAAAKTGAKCHMWVKSHKEAEDYKKHAQKVQEELQRQMKQNNLKQLAMVKMVPLQSEA